MVLIKVAALAKIVKLYPSTIRSWADKGLIECTRDLNGHRVFQRAATIRRIRGLQDGSIQPEKLSTVEEL